MTDRQIERAVAALSALTAVNAFVGALYGLRGAAKVPVEWLEGSPFHSYRIPSGILGVAVGGSSATAATYAWRGSHRAGPGHGGRDPDRLDRRPAGDHRTTQRAAAGDGRCRDRADRAGQETRLAPPP